MPAFIPLLDDSPIDLREELSDAGEVYQLSQSAESSVTLRTSHGRLAMEYEDGELFIDEIRDGEIAFTANVKDPEGEFSGLFKLDAEGAERLGHILLRSAQYAKDQEVRG